MKILARLTPTNKNLFGSIKYRRKPHQFIQLEAEIEVRQHTGLFEVCVALLIDRRRINYGHMILTGGECANPERAWLAGYNLAWNLAHKHGVQRLYIRDVTENRRRAAA